jgi:hypothetical protein
MKEKKGDDVERRDETEEDKQKRIENEEATKKS